MGTKYKCMEEGGININREGVININREGSTVKFSMLINQELT